MSTLGIIRIALVVAVTSSVSSDDVMITVTDESGMPLSGAIAYIVVDNNTSNALNSEHETKIVLQKGEAFTPFISLSKVGDKFQFRNQDPITHHVYSFSKSKQLDLTVKPREKSQTFDLNIPGPIALGSSIHDHMTAFIYATPSPLNGISNEKGELIIKGVPDGQHSLYFWHYKIPKSETRSQLIDTASGKDLVLMVATKRATPLTQSDSK
jgi:plastocyanin